MTAETSVGTSVHPVIPNRHKSWLYRALSGPFLSPPWRRRRRLRRTTPMRRTAAYGRSARPNRTARTGRHTLMAHVITMNHADNDPRPPAGAAATYTVKEIAALLGLSLGGTYQAIRAGE